MYPNLANRDPKTGTSYGVIGLHKLQDWVFEEFFNHGTNLTMQRAAEEFREENPDADDEEFDEYMSSLELDEEEYSLEKDGMKLGLHWLGGAPLVWVFHSEKTTLVKYCSPCCPGAGDLSTRAEGSGDVLSYDLPDEWYADGF